jgi:hypothetical protein
MHMDPTAVQQASGFPWLALTKSTGVAGAVAAIVSTLLINLSKASESAKLAESNRQIVELRSDLQRVEDTAKIKMTLLQNKRVEAVLELYKLVAQVDEIVRFSRAQATNFDLATSENNRRIEGYEKLNECRLKIGELGVLFDEPLLEKLLKLVDELARQYVLTAVAIGNTNLPNTLSGFMQDPERGEERLRRLTNIEWAPLTDLIKSVRDDMREILGKIESPKEAAAVESTGANSSRLSD